MSDTVLYKEFLKGIKGKGRSGKPDPRLVALVRFLARRAAERDYERLLAKRKASKKTT